MASWGVVAFNFVSFPVPCDTKIYVPLSFTKENFFPANSQRLDVSRISLFSLILDYTSRLYYFIQNEGIQALEEEFERWIGHPTGLGKGKGQFSDNRGINSITGHFLKRFMKAFRSEIESETPLVVAQSKTKIWIGEPTDRSGPYLISLPQGLPMIQQHREKMYDLPCFFWSKFNSTRSGNSWIKPFGVPGYRHPPKNLQWVLYREFICTYSSNNRGRNINPKNVGTGPYGYFD